MAKWLIFFFIFVLSAPLVDATIRINEVLIDPMQKIELLNVGTTAIDISNWYLDDSGGTTYFTIPQNISLQPNSCRVFESDFNLNKTNADAVRLFDKTAAPTSMDSVLIDSFSYKASSGSGISFKRGLDATWATGTADLGLHNATQISCLAPDTPSPTVAPTSTPLPTQAITPFDYENVYISEIMVNPLEGEGEWVEFYNENSFALTLENWYLDDQENAGSSPKKFSLEIAAGNYAVLELSSSIFNNDGDAVRLLNTGLYEKDSVSYSTSTRGMSLGRPLIPLSNLCTQTPSKGAQNTGCYSDLLNEDETTSGSAASIPQFSPSVESTSAPLSSNIFETRGKVPDVATDEGSVLSSKTTLRQDKSTGISHKYFSFVALSYSLLTICSILLKMKLSA